MTREYDMDIEETEKEISPSIWMGTYGTLAQQQFMDEKNIKVIVNCSGTCRFIEELNGSGMNISSDLIILLLDPSFDVAEVRGDKRALLHDYMEEFNKILQNYISFFYRLNPQANNLIHKFPQDRPLSMSSPILTGNLKTHFFNINRLIKLLKNINDTIGILIVSQDGDSHLSTAVAMSYLMDSYNFNFDASFTNLKIAKPLLSPLNSQYYDDLLIAENLKKFYYENSLIKQNSSGLLMANCKLKRKNETDFITVGDGAKRKNVN